MSQLGPIIYNLTVVEVAIDEFGEQKNKRTINIFFKVDKTTDIICISLMDENHVQTGKGLALYSLWSCSTFEGKSVAFGVIGIIMLFNVT